MNRITISATALSVLLLGACAGEPEAPQVAAPAESAQAATPAQMPAADAPKPAESEKVPFQIVDAKTGQVIPAGQATVAETMPAEPKAPETMAQAPERDKGTIVYLASYKTEAAAKRGWAVLAKASPILAKQKPITRSVELGRKGTFVRLYGMAADEAGRAAICKQVGKRVDECGARNRE